MYISNITMDLKYKLVICICILLALMSGCSASGKEKPDNDNFETSSPGIQQPKQDNGVDSWTKVIDEKLSKKLIELVNTNIEIQNRQNKADIGKIYTKGFISRVIEKNSNFFINIVVLDYMSDYPLILTNENEKQYLVINRVKIANDKQELFQYVFVKRDKIDNLRIFDIQYDV